MRNSTETIHCRLAVTTPFPFREITVSLNEQLSPNKVGELKNGKVEVGIAVWNWLKKLPEKKFELEFL